MPDFIPVKKVDSLVNTPPVETVAEKYPPLEAWSTTTTAAVIGINSKGGDGVYGKSSGNAGAFDGNVRRTATSLAAETSSSPVPIVLNSLILPDQIRSAKALLFVPMNLVH